MRAGYFDTPANATASSSTSSSASTASCPGLHQGEELVVRRESPRRRSVPTTRSVITDAEACEIEQPIAVVGHVA